MVALAFDEGAALRLLNWLAEENARIFRVYDRRAKAKGEAPLPGLYESGVRYEREDEELWSDVLNLYLQGFEDCDALAAARAGELQARGYKALSPRDEVDPVRYPGDEGLALAWRLKIKSIPAEVILTTRARPGRPGLYHCIVKYQIGGKVFYDDPSARLGMFGDPQSQEVQQGLSSRDLSGRPENGAREILMQPAAVVGYRGARRIRPENLGAYAPVELRR